MTRLVLTNEFAEILFIANGLAVVLFFAARKKKKQRAMKFGNYETLKKVSGNDFLKTNNIMLVLKFLTITTLVAGISQPVIEEEVVSSNSDYVIAIDNSASMLSSDIEPSRLEAARKTSQTFVQATEESTDVGLVEFSGTSRTVMPPSDEHPEVRESIENITVGEKAGTAIGSAIFTGSSALDGSKQSREVILVTDGRNNVGANITSAIEFARKKNVSVNTVGLGTRNSSEPRNDSRASFPNLDTSNLKKIANRTGGNFTTATNRSELRNAFLEQETTTEENEISRYFILAGLLLILIEWSLGVTRYDILP
ncbi:MAG: VWA domain-containing protein [Candidatus Nanohaloarchaea archaeon]